MIRSFFGLSKDPFAHDRIDLLGQQQEIHEMLYVHCRQGGLCLVLGEPGTGKSVVKDSLAARDPQRLIVPLVSRTLHTHASILRLLCHAFSLDSKGNSYQLEKRLLEAAHALNKSGKMLAPVIDDAHLLDIDCLRRLRLLFDEFPKNHNLILIGQTPLLELMTLTPNEDIRSRITYSVILHKLVHEDIAAFVLSQFDMCGLGHNTITEDALSLIARSADGILRRARNLALASLLEAAHERTRPVDIAHVNRALIQPHWRRNHDMVQT